MGGFSFDVIVCGSLHLDIMIEGGRLPQIDETVVGAAWGMKCGGKGGNQAVMAARMGARVAMIGRIGQDDFGTRLLANLDEAGVDRRAIEIDPHAGSGMSVAIVDPAGDYGAVIVSGANLNMDGASSAAQFAELGGAAVLVLQNEIPEAVNVAVAQAAGRRGTRVILNAAPARRMGKDFLNAVDLLVVNRVEAEMLSGQPVFDQASAKAALLALGGDQRDSVITLGGQGLVYQAKGTEPKSLAPHPVLVVSTHGAGDCFLGALATTLAQGQSLAVACETANAMAARFVSTPDSERTNALFVDIAHEEQQPVGNLFQT